MEKIKFTNATMFALAMNNEKFCAGLLERVMGGRKVADLLIRDKVDLDVEENIIASLRAKKVTLDVRFSDSEGWYCFEMQVRNEHNIEKRSRYYHSVIDTAEVKEGDKYKDIKAGYVIFLCCFDPFEKDKAKYDFVTYDPINSLQLDDQRYTMILNSKASEVPDELRTLFDYINNDVVDADDSLIQEIDEFVVRMSEGKVGEYLMTIQDVLDLKDEQLAEKDRIIKEQKEINASNQEIIDRLVREGKISKEDADLFKFD